MKRTSKIVFGAFGFAALMWAYYSNNEGLARQHPNDLLIWEHVTQYLGIVLLTLIVGQIVGKWRVEKRWHQLASQPENSNSRNIAQLRTIENERLRKLAERSA